jgi:hypothetical protein
MMVRYNCNKGEIKEIEGNIVIFMRLINLKVEL